MNRPVLNPGVTETAGPARFTTAEFLAMIEAGAFADMKVELIRGELERMPPPGTSHARWQSRVLLSLASVVDRRLILGEVGVDLGEDSLVGCDAAVLRGPVAENRMLTADDLVLVIEIAVSSIGRDMGLKRSLYAGAGVAHYWIVDAEREVVHLCAEPISGEYRTIASIRFGEPIPVPGTDRTITLD